jgi:hypothetical protein
MFEAAVPPFSAARRFYWKANYGKDFWVSNVVVELILIDI